MDEIVSRTGIISNKAFIRLGEKTQVVFPKHGREETTQNRLTHSYAVANSAMLIARKIEGPRVSIDRESLFNTCLLHDIGHPPLGHDGSKILSAKFKSLGVEEGFSDNSNNFVVLEKNQINISDYTMASLIKYPERLYPYQKPKLHRVLEDAILEDIVRFDKLGVTEKPRRTVGCEIMDEADRNTYVCHDLADCYSLGLANATELKEMYECDLFSSFDIRLQLLSLIESVVKRDKSLIKRAMAEINIMLNQNYRLGRNLKLEVEDEEKIVFREALYSIEKKVFIGNTDLKAERDSKGHILASYIDMVVHDGYCPSKTYERKIKQARDKGDVMAEYRAKRDMVAEATDWFVFKKMSSLNG